MFDPDNKLAYNQAENPPRATQKDKLITTTKEDHSEKLKQPESYSQNQISKEPQPIII